MRLFKLWFWKRYWFLFLLTLIVLYFVIGFNIWIFLISLLAVWFISLIKSAFKKKRRFVKRRKVHVPIKVKLDGAFRKEIHIKKKRKKKLNGNDLFRAAINASHRVIRKGGSKGHWKRQKARKYLLEKNKVVRKYKMN